ncbi:MAG TPA: hypothetical protein PKK10_01445 [Woeseiaceae bacterium]|nr:hypothetical protein [Woeseiaceae bacterium]
MSTMFYVVCIVAIACGTAVMGNYFKARGAISKSDEDLERTGAQIAALEERIRVLERIVTENKFDLRQEIDRL